jgi:hypothetical protein
MHIVEARDRKGLEAFLQVPFTLYREDPFFGPLPLSQQRRYFCPKNPFFLEAQVRFFVLRSGRDALGRVAAFRNDRHLRQHQDGAGFFGFFECINDHEAAALLMDAASEALRGWGLGILRGPMNFSTNEECGFLVEGFSLPPMLMTPYNPPYYGTLMEALGLRKAKDLLGFRMQIPQELPEKVLRVARLARARGLRARPIRMRQLREELRRFQSLYNEAWKDNWGFVPISDEELREAVRRLRPVILPPLTVLAETQEGEVVGFLSLVPDLNEVLRKLRGRLGPLGFLKALWLRRRIQGLRLLLLGVRRGARARGVEALMFAQAFQGLKGLKRDFKTVEFSWVLQDNLPVIRLAQMAGARQQKRWRIYERPL